MELRHLRYLIAVAEEKSFVAAAARLQLAQPALSRQIRDLEDELGVDLFIREAAGSKLTPAGESAVRVAQTVLNDVKASLDRARNAEHGLVGKVLLGATRYPLWNGLIARIIERTKADYPGIEITIDESSSNTKWKALANAEIDVAFGTAPPAEYLQFVVETHSFDVMDSIVVAKTHPLAQKEVVTLEELSKETYLRHAPDAIDEPARLFHTELQRRGFAPKAQRQGANVDSLRMLVRAGAGWTGLPRSMRSTLNSGLAAVTIADIAVPFRYTVTHRRGDSRPVVQSVLRAIRRTAQHDGLAGVQHEPPSGVRKMAAASASAQIASRLELRHLRYFAAIIEHESIGRAAEALGLTQPAISRQIRDLEEDLGAALVHRGTRGVAPTLSGESLYTDAKRILRLADNIGAEAQRAHRGMAGRVHAGVVASPLVWEMLAKAAVTCVVNMPDVELLVEDVPTPRQAAALRSAQIDVTVGHRYPSMADLDPNITRHLLLPDTLNQAIVSVDHALAKKGKVSLKDLNEFPMLFMQRSFAPAFYDVVMSTFVRGGFTPRVDGRYDGLPTVWALAAQGMGWCFGAASQKKNPPHGCKLVEIEDFTMPWGYELAYRSDESRPAVLEVIQSLLHAAQDLREGMTSQETKYWPEIARSA